MPRDCGMMSRIDYIFSGTELAAMIKKHTIYKKDKWNMLTVEVNGKQLILREILIQGQTQDMIDMADESLMKKVMEAESIKYGVVVVANLPVLMLYPFLQRFFVKGMMVGALTG